MTIFHYINVRMQNIPKFVSKIGVDFMHYAIEEWASKSMYSLPSINVNPRECIKVNIYRGVNN
jgi:hypothetical protein